MPAILAWNPTRPHANAALAPTFIPSVAAVTAATLFTRRFANAPHALDRIRLTATVSSALGCNDFLFISGFGIGQ